MRILSFVVLAQVKNANVRLNPGDMVSVDPKAMTILHPTQTKTTPATEATTTPADEDSSEATPPSTSTSPESEANTEANSETEPKIDSASPQVPITSPKGAQEKPTFKFPPYSAPFLFLPAYIEANFATCSAIYVRHPTARPGYSEIPTPYDADGEVIRFAWEWYSKVRPRTPRKNSRWKSPELARS